MKTTVALMGSPRRNSNTDILLDKAIEGIRSNTSENEGIEKLIMTDYQGYVCNACGECRTSGECRQYEKVNEALSKIKGADGLVIATPTWWMAPSSPMKIFMDHWGAFLAPDYTSRIAGKRALIISCNGNNDVNFADQVCSGIESMLNFLQVDVKGRLGVKGLMEKGAAAKDRDGMDKAFNLGTLLYKEA